MHLIPRNEKVKPLDAAPDGDNIVEPCLEAHLKFTPELSSLLIDDGFLNN